MKIKTLVVGDLYTNCYVLFDEKTKIAFIIDPGDDADKILAFLKDNQLSCNKIILTHCHPDHVMAAETLKDTLGAEIYMSGNEVNFFNIKVDRDLKEGEKIEEEGILIKVLDTPGHTSGSISLLGKGFILSGDTLFAGGIGRTDLPGGSYEKIKKSLKSIMKLPNNFTVHPGHGKTTTIADEKKHNGFLVEILQ